MNGPSREYLENMADAEDAAGSVSVGGMAADMNQPLPCPHCGAASAGSCNGMAIYCCGSDDHSRSASCQITELKRQRDAAQLSAGRNQSRADQCDQWQIEATERLKKYRELVDALTSPGLAPRDDHDSVIALAKRMKARELTIKPMGNDDS